MDINQAEHKRVLVVFPHPDDEAFAAAGTLAKYIDSGAGVTYACLTLGRWDGTWESRHSRTGLLCRRSARKN